MPPRRFTKQELLGGSTEIVTATEVVVTPQPTTSHETWQTELTQPLVDQLVNNCANMPFKRHAALAACVLPELFEWWLSQGMRPDSPLLMVQLSVRVHCVYAQQNIAMINVVRMAALSGDWEAAVTLLARRFPEWNGKQEVYEKDTVAPELSLEERRLQMTETLRNPQGDLAVALKAALQDPNSGLVRLLTEVKQG